MELNTGVKILDIQEQAISDQRYCRLMEEYKLRHEAFLRLLHSMEQSEQDTILDYLGVCIDMHLRLLELAVNYNKIG